MKRVLQKDKKEIVHLALRTGYTFKSVFGHLDETIKLGEKTGYIGIADLASTFSHPMLEQRCNTKRQYAETYLIKQVENIKPIYAVRLTVVEDATIQVKPRGQFGAEYIFIAKNNSGLSEMYNLVKKFYENFYYRGNISLSDVYALSKNVIVIAESFHCEKRIDYIALTTSTPKKFANWKGIPKVAIVNNYYPTKDDFDVYELFTHPNNTDKKTYPQHILSTDEWRKLYKGHPEIEDAIDNTHVIAKQCAGIQLKKAPMLKYHGKETIEFLCKRGAKKLGIDIVGKGVYRDRYEREITLIREKDFQDYFLVVADMIRKAKKKMFVGPGRGSSGGSLVCYLLGITSGMDPIKFGLLFERFIDINRSDLPDIDIDFPDNKRGVVIRQLMKDYGEENVKHIANISKMQPKVAITEFAKSLGVPAYETKALKNAIVDRESGDARAAMKIVDTLESTDTGKDFVKKFPEMKLVAKIETHPRHTGVHASGILVCNSDVSEFCGINGRDNTAMVDKKTSEYLNLLKIDILGLTTLAILEECADLIGWKYEDFYSLPIDDEKAFSIFNEMRLSGVFQFEGHSMATITRKMTIESFEDIVAINALSRPGALYSGGASRYVKRRTGVEEVYFAGEEHKKITQNTYGIVVYQEQILTICRDIGEMSWDDVNALRRALSKSMGKEFFNRYKEKFMAGAKKNGYSLEDAEFIWNEIENGGAYAFNRSHAVAYALISYWCAYVKARYPLEFLVANLNNGKNVPSSIKILRDAVNVEGVSYVPVDPDESTRKWSVNSEGIVVGPLTNVVGIGPAKADMIIKARKTGDPLPPGLILKLAKPVTEFDVLNPCERLWGDIYDRPRAYGLTNAPCKIVEVQGKGEYLFIGKLMTKNIRDLNEYVNLQKRGGEVLTENSLSLSIVLQDDSDSIMCNVNRFNYARIGHDIAEHGVTEEDWYLVKGKIKWDGRYVDISEIMKLDNSMVERQGK